MMKGCYAVNASEFPTLANGGYQIRPSRNKVRRSRDIRVDEPHGTPSRYSEASPVSAPSGRRPSPTGQMKRDGLSTPVRLSCKTIARNADPKA